MRFTLAFLAVCVVISSAIIVFAQEVPPVVEPSEPENTVIVLPAGVPVRLVLLETLRSQSNHKGDLVTFEVADDIMLNGVVVVPKGALAYGQITELRSRRGLGKGGKLDAEINHIFLPGGVYIPLATEIGQASGFEGGKMLSRYIVWSLFTGVGAFVALGTKGKAITIEHGLQVNVFTAEETPIAPQMLSSGEGLLRAVEKERENAAIEAVSGFGFGAKKVKDVLADRGLGAEASWIATKHDDYTYLVTVAGNGQSFSWLVNPFQDAYSKKYLKDKIAAIDKASEEIISAVD